MPDPTQHLTRRERQIMDILFARGDATVNQIRAALPDPPTPMAVRRMMHILEEKGHLNRRERGREIVYTPRQTKDRAGRNAFRRVLETFFAGSLEEALAAHLLSRKDKISAAERDRLIKLIEQARKENS
ncbi:MAG TPA: BlaI/MecI/CopY family transcriptional regulator [Chthoniobacteraceae bacterium]|nr:BlaI/MecI/CopY family transcriptional regulator [Chthoniobacteraceae bacterium]